MKKKILSIALVVCIAITVIAGATLAYLQDADKDVNVMTLGNVYIVQNETDRTGAAFQQNQKLYPAVKIGEFKKDGTVTDTDGSSNVEIWDTSINNEIDKFVSVTNEGTENAYVRTILLFETVLSYEEGSSDSWTDLHDHFFLINGDFDYLRATETTDDDKQDFTYVTLTDENGNSKVYAIAVKTYEEALEPEATTTSSLRQFALTWDAGNEVYDFFGAEYEILALSQAVQVAGFDSLKDVENKAENALNTAFGEVTPENVIKWFGTTGIQTTEDANVIPKFPAENN